MPAAGFNEVTQPRTEWNEFNADKGASCWICLHPIQANTNAWWSSRRFTVLCHTCRTGSTIEPALGGTTDSAVSRELRTAIKTSATKVLGSRQNPISGTGWDLLAVAASGVWVINTETSNADVIKSSFGQDHTVMPSQNGQVLIDHVARLHAAAAALADIVPPGVPIWPVLAFSSDTDIASGQFMAANSVVVVRATDLGQGFNMPGALTTGQTSKALRLCAEGFPPNPTLNKKVMFTEPPAPLPHCPADPTSGPAQHSQKSRPGSLWPRRLIITGVLLIALAAVLYWFSQDRLRPTLEPVNAFVPPELVVAELTGSDEPYDRNDYLPAWPTAAGSCKDLRAVILQETSTVPVGFTADGCKADTGHWVGTYNGAILKSASSVELDHAVPLAGAHRAGGWAWNSETRRMFAVDRVNIVVASKEANRAKSVSGPDDWMPTDPHAACAHARRWVAVKTDWELEFSQAEADVLNDVLSQC